MKLLIAIPCLYGYSHCKAAIDSVIGKNGVDVLIADNGAEQDVSDLIKTYDCLKIIEPVNIYVNPIWNKFIATFLAGGWDYLCIMNSDLTLQWQWSEVCKHRWYSNPDEILIPQMTPDVPNRIETYVMNAQTVTEGTAGVFITLNRKQAETVFPIPSEILCWFGDLYIFTILRALGYKTVIPSNLYSSHGWSQTISKVPGISQIIEQDKLAWANIVEPLMNERIAKYKCIT